MRNHRNSKNAFVSAAAGAFQLRNNLGTHASECGPPNRESKCQKASAVQIPAMTSTPPTRTRKAAVRRSALRARDSVGAINSTASLRDKPVRQRPPMKRIADGNQISKMCSPCGVLTQATRVTTKPAITPMTRPAPVREPAGDPTSTVGTRCRHICSERAALHPIKFVVAPVLRPLIPRMRVSQVWKKAPVHPHRAMPRPRNVLRGMSQKNVCAQ